MPPKPLAKPRWMLPEAMIEQAKLNLEWTKVYSPIDGIAGVATSQVGDLVGPSTKMTTISKVNPIRAYFSISENAYLRVPTELPRCLTEGPAAERHRWNTSRQMKSPIPARAASSS